MADQRTDAVTSPAPSPPISGSPDGLAAPGVGSEQPVRAPGWREVLVVAAVIVAIVLGLAVATSFLPADAQGIIFKTPLLIVVLIVGTAAVLVRLVQRPPEG